MLSDCSLNRILGKYIISSHLQLLNNRSGQFKILSSSFLPSPDWIVAQGTGTGTQELLFHALLSLFKLSWAWGQGRKLKGKVHESFSWASYWNWSASLLLWLMLTRHLYPLWQMVGTFVGFFRGLTSLTPSRMVNPTDCLLLLDLCQLAEFPSSWSTSKMTKTLLLSQYLTQGEFMNSYYACSLKPFVVCHSSCFSLLL